MSNASLKDQLQAVASQLSDTLKDESRPVENVKQNKPIQNKPIENKPIQNKPIQKSPHSKVALKSKPKWLELMQYGVELLKAYFPDCFKSGSEAKPLKKGIKQDLVKRLSTMGNIVTEDKACMVKSLAYYVNTMSYHKNVIEGVMRIDLDGQSAGLVIAEEAKYSLERNQAKIEAKKNVNKPSLELEPA